MSLNNVEIEEFDIWYDKYKPINKIKENTFLYETYGEDLDYINIISGEYIWTLIDTDNGLYLVNGRHFVNRINYIICEIPHNINERIEYKYDEHGENR